VRAHCGNTPHQLFHATVSDGLPSNAPRRCLCAYAGFRGERRAARLTDGLKTDETLLSWPHHASAAACSPTPSLQRSFGLALNIEQSGRQHRLEANGFHPIHAA
jgi:hypothetical protein